MSKKCPKCTHELPTTSFSACKKSKDGLNNYCKPCRSLLTQEWKARNPEKAKEVAKRYRKSETSILKNREAARRRRETHPELHREVRRNNALKSIYGISSADYSVMLEKQHGVCKICNGSCTSGRRLAVDHCHVTGKVRGLLCSRCNTSIGKFEDSVDLLKSAIAYLEASR